MTLRHQNTDSIKRALYERRIIVLHVFLGIILLLIIGRLVELQIMKGSDYQEQAQKQQYGGVVLSAKRGEILGRSSKTDETSILATNTTLDLLYIDPLIISERHAEIADDLADLLITPAIDARCRSGTSSCPAELISFYQSAFDPLARVRVEEITTASGELILRFITGSTLTQDVSAVIPDMLEVRRRFARSIEERIRQTSVTFVPLLYGANKEQVASVSAQGIPGIEVNAEQSLVYANPNAVEQQNIDVIARTLAPVLSVDPSIIANRLRQRPLRYVPVMSRIPATVSEAIRALKEKKGEEWRKHIEELPAGTAKNRLIDPYRAVALIPEHWRFYPDTKIASHVVGFINAIREPQYGVERSFNTQLRGQEGLIASVQDPTGGQILSAEQTYVDPRDGATVVLTIDRIIQAKVESLLEAMVRKVDAESGQVIVMDPRTGRIVAMANAPLFDNNSYAAVYEKEPIIIPPEREKELVAEIFHPETNARVLKAYLPDIAPDNRKNLSQETQQKIAELEKLYDLSSLTRIYMYLGDNNRREVFPTQTPHLWLKYKNNIGVGSYVNRTIQEVYEPGSVMKPITMAIAIDQGETAPGDIYFDSGAVKVDIYTIKNALNKYYGRVTMTDCLDFSINTCMTSISNRMGRQLFHAGLELFGFGQVTGIELDNEQPGVLPVLRDWNPALLMTLSFGQGISVTPLQMTAAFAALANGGKLMKPTIVDEIRNSDGTVFSTKPEIIQQVIKPETADTITSMLVHGAEHGFAKAGKVKGYRIAGKTGTSQIAGPGGKYESGTGSTVASYAGYAPVDHPRFVVLVKLDRPKKDDFGSRSAAPLFADIAKFLFEYYGIPPDEK